MAGQLEPGELFVTLEWAQELKNCDLFKKQDPYVTLTVGKTSFKSKTHNSKCLARSIEGYCLECIRFVHAPDWHVVYSSSPIRCNEVPRDANMGQAVRY